MISTDTVRRKWPSKFKATPSSIFGIFKIIFSFSFAPFKCLTIITIQPLRSALSLPLSLCSTPYLNIVISYFKIYYIAIFFHFISHAYIVLKV